MPTIGERIRGSVRAALGEHERVLLAVSGGLDSSVLLDAASAVLPPDRIVVATFDHGTGPAAERAVAAVTEAAQARGLAWVAARATRELHSENELRTARWKFLRAESAARRAVVATAHTASDQVETVLMRVLRGTGARGLAGLAASSDIVRPLLAFSRGDVEHYAREAGLRWTDDPSNESRRFLRNRVRHDLLPALCRVRPGLGAELQSIGARAAEWRRDVEAFVDAHVQPRVYAAGGVDVPAESVSRFTEVELSVLWPDIAARAGATLDRRAIARVAAFTLRARAGARAQLAGGWEVIRSRTYFELRTSGAATGATDEAVPLSNAMAWGHWSFRASRGDERGTVESPDSWRAWLPIDQPLFVRAWRAGDRLDASDDRRARKVKELLTSAGVTGHRRAGWPVVLVGDQIVWIPGVALGDAGTARPGQPGLLFMCEYTYR